jgi:flagellar basal-body rod protein FlgC
MTDPLSIALSGLKAATTRASAAASNIANATTSGAREGTDGPKPYTPIDVVQTSISTQDGEPQGTVATYVERQPASIPSYEPDATYADSNGFVASPNVNMIDDIVDLKTAAQAYQANAAVVRVTSEMEKELFDRFDENV